MRIVVSLAIAAAFAMPATAQDTPTASGPDAPTSTSAEGGEAPAARDKEDGKICRNISQVGSRKKERKCLTQKEWIKFNRGE